MENIQRGFIVPLLLAIFAILFIGAYIYTEPTKQPLSAIPAIQTVPVAQNAPVVESVPTANLPVAVDVTEPNISKPSVSPVVAVSSAPSSPSPAPFVAPAPSKSQVSTITACTDIHTSGAYTLDRDIVSPEGESCIKIHDTTNVEINCSNHSIATDIGFDALSLNKVKNFSVSSCLFKNKNPDPLPDALSPALSVSGSQNGSITKNTFTGPTFTSINGSSNIVVDGNTVYGQFQTGSSREISIKNNSFIFIPSGNQTAAGTLISLANGSNNKVIGNTFDGGSDGIFRGSGNSVGADDSILISDESGDIFQDNDIKNNWDCGIENLGFIFDGKMVNNRIKNAGVGGICGWYYSSVKGNSFTGNVIDDSPEIFHFFRAYGVKYGSDPKVYFKDNVFNNNKLVNQRDNGSVAGPISSSIYIDIPGDNGNGIRPVTKEDIVVGNNIFTNNDFGKIRAPFLYPKEMIVDGGGNRCAQPTDTAYPLKCVP